MVKLCTVLHAVFHNSFREYAGVDNNSNQAQWANQHMQHCVMIGKTFK